MTTATTTSAATTRSSVEGPRDIRISVITIAPANASRLGFSEPAYMPADADTKFFIGKIDHNLANAHRLSVRVITETAWHSLFARNMFRLPPAD